MTNSSIEFEDIDAFFAKVNATEALGELNSLKQTVLGKRFATQVQNKIDLLLERERRTLENERRTLENERRTAEKTGTFFASFNEVFDKEISKELNRANLRSKFKEIARQSRPPFFDDVYRYKPDSRRQNADSRSQGTNPEFPLLEVDIFGVRYDKQRAHLLPDGDTIAPLWGAVAEGAVGIIEERCIRKEDRKKLAMGVEGKAKEVGFRGVRYSARNFIRFASHRELFDHNPQVIILPILPLQAIRGWKCTPYSALVITCDNDGHSAADAYGRLLPNDFNYDECMVCSPADVAMATHCLRKFMVGLGATLMNGMVKELTDDPQLKAGVKLVTSNVKNNGIYLPEFEEEDVEKWRSLRPIMKISFKDRTLPDPWLLMAKGAVNCSAAFGQQLLPSCEYPDYDSMEELSWWSNSAKAALNDDNHSPSSFLTRIIQVPSTPSRTTTKAAVVTPLNENDFVDNEDWENLGG